MGVNIGADVVQTEKLWKALVTSYVAHGKPEANSMTMASTEIAARAVPMIAPTATPANLPPPPIRQSAGGGRGPLTTLA